MTSCALIPDGYNYPYMLIATNRGEVVHNLMCKLQMHHVDCMREDNEAFSTLKFQRTDALSGVHVTCSSNFRVAPVIVSRLEGDLSRVGFRLRNFFFLNENWAG